MKHLHCATCKFTLPVNDSKEAAAYRENVPMHCGTPMESDAPSVVPPKDEVPKEEALPKEEKKGFFSRSKKKK